MKAYVLHGINDLRYENVEEPELISGWCIVSVKAVGICSSDIPRIFKKGTYHFPTIPGHEFSGIVTKVADSENNKWIGKRVSVFPLIPCRKCDQCKQKKYEMCENYDYIGSRRDGAFADHVAVPVWNLIEIAPDTTFVQAAMMEPLAVAFHAVKQADISKGSRIAVIGSGMIGFSAAVWAKKFGAESVCVVGQSDKTDISNRLNIEYVKYENINGRLFDIVIEAVGTEAAISNAIQITGASGKIILLGNPNGNIQLDQDVYWRLLRKQITCIGTWNSGYEAMSSCDWSSVKEALRDGSVCVDPLVTHKFGKEELMTALNIMKNKKEIFCKIIVEWDKEDQEGG